MAVPVGLSDVKVVTFLATAFYVLSWKSTALAAGIIRKSRPPLDLISDRATREATSLGATSTYAFPAFPFG